jgi:hypothetical protein
MHQLTDKSNFRAEYDGKVWVIFLDIPFGYLIGNPSDRRLPEDYVKRMAVKLFTILHMQGTLIVRMGDHDADMWRNALHAAGFMVDQSRMHVVQEAPWTKQKQCFSYGHTTNVVHYWLIAHRSKNYYDCKTNFGKCLPLTRIH